MKFSLSKTDTGLRLTTDLSWGNIKNLTFVLGGLLTTAILLALIGASFGAVALGYALMATITFGLFMPVARVAECHMFNGTPASNFFLCFGMIAGIFFGIMLGTADAESAIQVVVASFIGAFLGTLSYVFFNALFGFDWPYSPRWHFYITACGAFIFASASAFTMGTGAFLGLVLGLPFGLIVALSILCVVRLVNGNISTLQGK